MSRIGQCNVCGETRKLEKSRNRCHPCATRARRARLAQAPPVARPPETGDEPDRTCTRCGITKPAAAFHRLGPGKRLKRCGECRAATRRSRAGQPRPQEEGAKFRAVLRTHGITEEQHETLLAAQGGRCAVCAELPKGNRRLVIDHCHTSRRVRALLCDRCNLAVGNYEFARELAEKYLAQYGRGNPLLGYDGAR